MPSTVAKAGHPHERASFDPAPSHLGGRSTAVDLTSAADERDRILRNWIKDAIRETKWKLEALTAHMYPDRDNKAYVSKVLNGEKPVSGHFVRLLPDDVEVLVVKSWAESFGLIVVFPDRDPATAARHLVSGLIGLMTPPAAPRSRSHEWGQA